jgi:predicted MFS family arabinose efflux permease
LVCPWDTSSGFRALWSPAGPWWSNRSLSLLALACLIAPLSTGVAWLAFALFLLGLGWNFCFVAGSALLDGILRPHEKGRVQGITETVINIASGVGSMGSGLIFAAFGFAVMSWGNILIAMIPVVLVVLSKVADQRTPARRAAST